MTPPISMHLICLPSQCPPAELPALDGNVLERGSQTRSRNVQILSSSGFAEWVWFLLLLLSFSRVPSSSRPPPPPPLKEKSDFFFF